MNSETFITIDGTPVVFSSKQELLKVAFEIWSDILTSDEILDKCAMIWTKWQLANSGSDKT